VIVETLDSQKDVELHYIFLPLVLVISALLREQIILDQFYLLFHASDVLGSNLSFSFLEFVLSISLGLTINFDDSSLGCGLNVLNLSLDLLDLLFTGILDEILYHNLCSNDGIIEGSW
jgi:hypothetical protein